MTEIFEDISEEVKRLAESAWNITIAQGNPIDAANFLNNTTNYYSHILNEHEMEFLRFYFQTRMEMMRQ